MTVRLAKGTPSFVAGLWIAPLLVRRWWARVAFVGLAAGCTWFFRDPPRTPDGQGLVAASDGVVQWVRTDNDGRVTVSTYLNLLDVHVTRAPCDALVVERTYRAGAHRPAFSPEAHLNERMEWRLVADVGELLLVQHAGTVARRIVAHRSPGARTRRGEAIGLIRFGSRVDLVLPVGVHVLVNQGDRLRGGATIVAVGQGRA